MLFGCSLKKFRYEYEDLEEIIESILIVYDVSREHIENGLYNIEYDILTTMNLFMIYQR